MTLGLFAKRKYQSRTTVVFLSARVFFLIMENECNAHDGFMFTTKAMYLAMFAALATVPASATVINYTGDDPARTFNIWMRATYNVGDMLTNGQLAVAQQTINEQVPAGVMNLIVDGTHNVDAFCVDYFVLIGTGNHNVNLLGQNSINGGGRIEWMLRNTLPAINAQVNATLKRQQAAALQLAIWDIVHDNGDGFTAGRIQQSTDANNLTNSVVLSNANSFLAASLGRTQLGGVVYQNVLGPNVTQRLISDGVPEPSSYALMLTGLAMVGYFRRGRR